MADNQNSGITFWHASPEITPITAHNFNLNTCENMVMTWIWFLSSVISELVDSAQKQEEDTCELDDAVQSVFMAILRAPGLDLRDKKAGIIDFIAAGIKTVSIVMAKSY